MPLSREADRERQRRRRQDPEVRERERIAQAKRYRSEEYRRKTRERYRWRYKHEPGFAEKERERNRKGYVPRGTRASVRRPSINMLLERQSLLPTEADIKAAAKTDEIKALVEEQLKDDHSRIASQLHCVSLNAYNGSEEDDEDTSYANVIGYEHDFESGEQIPVNFMRSGPKFLSARTDVKRRKRRAA